MCHRPSVVVYFILVVVNVCVFPHALLFTFTYLFDIEHFSLVLSWMAQDCLIQYCCRRFAFLSIQHRVSERFILLYWLSVNLHKQMEQPDDTTINSLNRI